MEKVKDRRGGSIPHPRGLISGWGINDSDYPLTLKEYNGRTNGKQNIKLLWTCPYFSRWAGIVERCYSERWQKKNPSYVGCSVCDEWKYFMAFRAWMLEQDWEGKELDKDLLVPGNKVYSPETCIFISKDLNLFFKSPYKKVGASLPGVTLRKDNFKYKVMCKQLDGTEKYLGQYEDEEAAGKVWLKEKRRLAEILASQQEDVEIQNAILRFYQ